MQFEARSFANDEILRTVYITVDWSFGHCINLLQKVCFPSSENNIYKSNISLLLHPRI